MKQEDEIEMILKESEEICNQLNKAMFEGRKSLKLPVAYYSVARFVAQFLYDAAPSFDGDPLESLNSTIKNILQAYEDEGKDDTHRLLRFVSGTPELENQSN